MMFKNISEIELIILRFITKRFVRQSEHHKKNIVEYFKILIREFDNEFTEDNKLIRNKYLNDCLDIALRSIKK